MKFTEEMKLALWTYEEVFRGAIDTFGEDKQLDVAIEEMAELTKEIIKRKRGRENDFAIAEEVADVLIMMQQIMIMIDDYDTVYALIRAKVDRLKGCILEKSGGEK